MYLYVPNLYDFLILWNLKVEHTISQNVCVFFVSSMEVNSPTLRGLVF